MKKTMNTIIMLCFLASGMAGLIYEVVWARRLTLVFGNTTFAYATILTVFMIGLAIGSKVFGKFVDKAKNPVKVYALIEAGVGIYALLFPYLIRLEEHFSFLYTPESHFLVSGLVLFLFVFFILIVPTVLMGGTLPIISKYAVTRFQKRGEKIGKLYALNTFGAVLGCFLAGYVFIARLGISGSIALAASLNLLIGLICLVISKKTGPTAVEKEPDLPPAPAGLELNKIQFKDKIVLTCFFLSGLTAMVYEVTWSRILSLLLGSSVYAFAAMLTTFLLGLALGSYLFSVYYRNRIEKVTHTLFGMFEIRIGFLCLLTIPLFNELGYWSYIIHSIFSETGAALQFFKFFLVFLVMILPTLLLGATFPLVSQLLIKSYKNLGKEIGTVYFWNTIGSTLGSFLVGFLFIPLLGIKNSILLAVFINILAGNVLIFQDKLNRKKLVISTLSILLVFSMFTVPLDLKVDMLTHGLYLPVGEKIPTRQEFHHISKATKLLFYKEGLSSIVSLHKSRRNIFLRINGKVDASTNPLDMSTQLLLGHLPFFFSLKPSYDHAVVIGMGSGVTAAAVVKHPVKTVYQVEIEKAVVEAGRFFKDVNENVLENPRVKTIIADGRHFVQNFDGQFDVITSEPSNPWMAGIGSLFTEEFYKIAYSKLTTGGVFCQWLHGYRLSPELFKMILKTFYSVFPDSYLWFSGEGDYLLIGQKNPAVPGPGNGKIDYLQLSAYLQRNPAAAKDLEKIAISTPYALSALFLLDGKGLAQLTVNSPKNTDDFPLLEFYAPRDLYRSTEALNFKGLVGLRSSSGIFKNVPHKDDKAKAGDYFACARMLRFRSLSQQAAAYCQKAIAKDPGKIPPYHLLARLYLLKGAYLQAENVLFQAIEAKDHAAAHNLLAELYLGRDLPGKALVHLEKSLELEPGNLGAIKRRASVLFASRDYREALRLYKQVLQLKPSDIETRLKMAQVHIKRQDYHQALDLLKGIPPAKMSSLAHRCLGDCRKALGDREKALYHYLEAFKIDPFSVETLTSLGICYFERNEFRQAADVFAILLRSHPYNLKALEYLFKVHQK